MDLAMTASSLPSPSPSLRRPPVPRRVESPPVGTPARADSIRRMEPQVLHGVTEHVATVVIRNPAKRNAMTAAMWGFPAAAAGDAGGRPGRTGAGAHR
ncbi:hypothetical protein GCM10023238_30940 [Streptomyces heliomycini]